jgi:dsDNA-specific endonuclease/ATPase MutS2
MDRESIVKELIEKVSALYREQRQKANQIRKEMNELEDKLGDKSIPYEDYIKMQNNMVYLDKKYQKCLDVADGISLAREELFDKI